MLIGESCLWSGIQWTAWVDSGRDEISKVSRAVVCDLGPPAIREWLEENVFAADVTVNDGVWFRKVQTVHSTAHIAADGNNMLLGHLFFLQFLVKAGGHKFSDNYRVLLSGCTNEQQQVRMAKLGSDGHFKSKLLTVVTGDDQVVKTFHGDSCSSESSHSYLAPASFAQHLLGHL